MVSITDVTGEIESAAASYIERLMTTAQVRVWADVFGSNNENDRKSGKPHKKSQIILGHKRTDRRVIVRDPGRYSFRKIVTIEVRAETYTLRDHRECMAMMEGCIDALEGWQPFNEMEEFTGGTNAVSGYSKSEGLWVYAGQTSITTGILTRGQDVTLTSTEELFPPMAIGIGLYNSWVTDETLALDATIA